MSIQEHMNGYERLVALVEKLQARNLLYSKLYCELKDMMNIHTMASLSTMFAKYSQVRNETDLLKVAGVI